MYRQQAKQANGTVKHVREATGETLFKALTKTTTLAVDILDGDANLVMTVTPHTPAIMVAHVYRMLEAVR